MGTHPLDEQFITKLERRFTNLDPALIRAIANDYDSRDSQEIIRQLDILSLTAIADDDGEFDPSGTQGQHNQRSKQSQSSTHTPNESSQSGSSETGATSDLITLANALSINDGCVDVELSDIGSLRYFDELTDAQKITKLGEMFPRMKPYDYEHALKKAKGSFVVAVDSLLTHFLLLNEEKSLSEDQVPLKGVDGFGEEFTTVTKKRRRERKNKINSPAPGSPIIIPRYAPLNIPKDDEPTPTHRVKSPHLGSYAAVANQEFAKAAQYYKQSKSNPLMGGAAAYHSALAREQLEIARHRVSAEADAMVARQSSATHVDLHGINAEDGKRIALEYVNGWWDGLGEGRIKTGGKSRIGNGFDVVVGRGVHSVGGRGVLGPSVAKALFAAGWKVEVGSGVLVVKGRR